MATEQTPLAEAAPTPWLPTLVAFLVGFGWRAVLIQLAPVPYSFDGFQRWAGRDHILVQDWLPATQLLIWLTARAGGTMLVGRLVMAAVGGIAAALGTVLVMRIARMRHSPAAGTWAGWAFVVAACFGPWCSWGTVFYQESTFLLVLFGALVLATRPDPRLGDLAMGLLGLVRYEGWPCILIYIAWRRQGWSLVSTWGMLLWIGIRLSGIQGYQASPVNFADWEGITTRFTIAGWLHDAMMLGWRFMNSGGFVWISLGLLVAWRERRTPIVQLIGLLFLSQIAITFAWLAGLEVSTSRMVVIPVALAAALGSVAVPALLAQRILFLRTEHGRRIELAGVDPAPAHGTTVRSLSLAWIVPIGLAILLGVGLEDARRRMRVEGYRVRMETTAVSAMTDCPGCTWWVLPRRGLGTRERHDGCEVIQGISGLLAGDQFYCAPWVPSEDAMALYAGCAGTIRWDSPTRSYVVERHLAGSLPPLPLLPPDPTLRTDDDVHDE